MRHIQHPGPAAPERVCAVPTQVLALELTLPPGRSLLETLATVMAAHGARSAVLRLAGGGFFPFAYVMPAAAKTPEHAVYFSERFESAAPVQLAFASVTFGLRDGQPWLHCHAVWHDAQGTRQCGHLLPSDAVLLAPIQASAWLLTDASFQVRPDAQTRFALFQPEPNAPLKAATAPPASSRALAVRIGPNEDVCTALETLCRRHGIAHATVQGGVGSTVGVTFEDGRTVQPFITEMLIRQGTVHTNAQGECEAALDVSLVDFTGQLSKGRLARGANAVLVTFELLLVPSPPGHEFITLPA